MTTSISNVSWTIISLLVAGCINAQELTTGRYHGALICSDDSVKAWGAAPTLGNGTTNQSAVPVTVTGISGAQSLSAGGEFTLALLQDGSIWGWGYNSAGQLCDATFTSPRLTPVQAQGISDVVELAAGGSHVLALKSDGSLVAWGQNGFGSLGIGAGPPSSSAVSVPGLNNVVEIAAGHGHSLALKSDGTVWAWGRNNHGQLGLGSVNSYVGTPTVIPSLTDVASIACGYWHSVAVRVDGSVFCWGNNDQGQLGNSSWVGSSVPVQVSGLTNVVSVSSEHSTHNLAVKDDGTVWGWGANFDGQLGIGTNSFGSNVPVQVFGLTSPNRLATGGFFSLALDANGQLYSWGENDNGQLGNGSTSSTNMVNLVPDPCEGSSTTEISQGQSPSLVRLAPNPTSALAVLSLPPGLWTLRVQDVTGREVIKLQTSHTAVLDVQDWPDGCYTVQANDGQQLHSLRLVHAR